MTDTEQTRPRSHPEAPASENWAGPVRSSAVVIGGSLFVTLALGLWLRFWLAGHLQTEHTFFNLRHAHSHLGYYGVLFPLSWLALALNKGRAPSRRVFIAYGAAVAVATAGFVQAGYNLFSIGGSTVVGVLWLHVAWLNKHATTRERDWRALPPIGVLFCTFFIPPIGVLTSREPVFANQLVRVFLTLLLLNVFVPAALVRTRAPSAPVWLASTITASMGTAFPELALGCLAWLPLAWVVARSARQLPALLAALWMGLAAAFGAMATTLFSEEAPVAVAGLHYIVLGPLLLTFAWHRVTRAPPLLLAVYLGFVVVMCAAIVALSSMVVTHIDPTASALVAAWSGLGTVLCIAIATPWLVSRRDA